MSEAHFMCEYVRYVRYVCSVYVLLYIAENSLVYSSFCMYLFSAHKRLKLLVHFIPVQKFWPSYTRSICAFYSLFFMYVYFVQHINEDIDIHTLDCLATVYFTLYIVHTIYTRENLRLSMGKFKSGEVKYLLQFE